MKILSKVLVVAFYFGLAGCTNSNYEEPCPDEYFFLRPEELARIPYKDSTELTFVNTLTNDTLVFYGQGWDSTTFRKQEYYDCSGGGGLNFEKRQINFVNKSSKIEIHCWIETSKYGVSSFYFFEIGNQQFSFEAQYFSKFLWDPYIIQNHTYENVKIFKNDKYPQKNTTYNCYYNTTYGILKFERPDGNLEFLKMK